MGLLDEHGSGMGHEMAMFFHGGVAETILFSTWRINTVGGPLPLPLTPSRVLQGSSEGGLTGLAVSCLALCLIALLYEGLKVGREILQRRLACTCSCGQFGRHQCGSLPSQAQVEASC